jgi:hypothetical protein
MMQTHHSARNDVVAATARWGGRVLKRTLVFLVTGPKRLVGKQQSAISKMPIRFTDEVLGAMDINGVD